MRKIIVICIILGTAECLPVNINKQKVETQSQTENNIQVALEYERYLREVVETLEDDVAFRKKLDAAPESDIRTGKIAKELKYVSHTIRSKLDEIKRKEVDRLKQFALKKFEMDNKIDRPHLKVMDHLDTANELSFEADDFKKLILKTSHDLAEADKNRRKDFMQHEMQKEFEKQIALSEMDEKTKLKNEELLQLERHKHNKHNKHNKLHHPGNKAQLEEVWRNQDHMEGQEFEPRSFFMIHDVDGNGYWDEYEVKALFIKELDKVHQSNFPDDDNRERAEEMERMREHVFLETDTNKDGLISFEEFLYQTQRADFQKDVEWETVDMSPQFTHEEYLAFAKRRQQEIKLLNSKGMVSSHAYMSVDNLKSRIQHLQPMTSVLQNQQVAQNNTSITNHIRDTSSVSN